MPQAALTAKLPANKQVFVGVTAAMACLAFAAVPARAEAASWWSWLPSVSATQAEDTGGVASATTALASLPASSVAIAVNATPEGHWQFVTRTGDVYTAGTPDELKRAGAAVLPDNAGGFTNATLVLSRDSLFAGRDVLRNLPAAKDQRVAIGGAVLALRRLTDGTPAVAIGPGLLVPAGDRAAFLETLAQLAHPLEATRLRVLAITPGAAALLPGTPKFDAGEGTAAIDAVDPDHLAEALGAIPRQTVVITARTDGTSLVFAPSRGPERSVPVAPLQAAASAGDIDLVIVKADPPSQPGGRNWLWQRVAVGGLDHARKRGTLADFLDALLDGHGVFTLSLTDDGDHRVKLSADPVEVPLASAEGVTGWMRQAAGAVAAPITGVVNPSAIEARLVASGRRAELERRLLPGLPSSIPLLYLGGLALGLAAWPVARTWWGRLWPPEARADYANRRGFFLAQLLRALAFLGLFLPLVAIPAVLARLTGRIRRPPASTSRAGQDRAP